MTPSDLSIRHPVFAWMLMAGLLVFGGISYLGLGISQLPDVDFPVITITVTWAGAPPEVMEQAVADVIEDAVMSVDGTQLVQSTSQEGNTQIRVTFNLNQDINVALLEIQTKLSQAQRLLPQNIDPPIITKTNPEDQPIMWIAAYNPGGNIRDLALYVRDHLRDALTSVNGVGDVLLGGYVDPQMRIWLDNSKMTRTQITAQDVIDAVNRGNQLTPSGHQDLGPRESFVQVYSEFRNAAECNQLIIPARQNEIVWKPITIGNVGHCAEETDDIRRISRFKGIQPTIGLGVIKQHGTNAVAIGDAVKKRLEELRPGLPKGMDLGLVVDNTQFVKQSVSELLFTLGISVLLTSLVCYLFLGSLSSSFNVVLAIPVSLVGSLIALRFLGFTLNTFTLMALSLAIGIVVDDAIMVLENIVRNREAGLSRPLAALVGARQITPAATATSIAILAIFVPVVFMQGIVGKFFYQFGVVLSVTVLLSLLEALTLTPMRSSRFLAIGHTNRVTGRIERGMKRLSVFYRRLLAHCLNWRWAVLGVSFVIFLVSLFSIKTLRSEFLPPQDQSRFMATLYTPMGSSIQATDQTFKRAEAFFKGRPEIDTYYVAVGGFGGGLVNQGIMFVTLKEPGGRPIAPPFTRRPSQQEFMAFARSELQKLPGLERAALLDLSLTGFSAQRGYPIEFQLQGPDWNKLTAYSLEIRKRLAASGLMSDIDSDYNPNMPVTQVYVDRGASARRSVPVATISNAIASTVGGLKLTPNRYTSASGHRDDIQVKLLPTENEGADDLKRIQVRTLVGELLPLSAVVRLEQSKTLLSITRYNRERAVGIFGNFPPTRSQSEVLDGVKKISDQVLPPGYHVTLSGSSQALGESFRGLFGALLLGIVVAYMVLASQFNSFLHPVTILLALPFSVTGAIWSLHLTGTTLNIYSLIGILLLMGIVKKNSILLVEFTNRQRREARLPVREALLEACPVRLRPILMTSIAIIAAALPEAAAIGPGAEVIRPMAIAVIGGVLFSTLLTLFVVPCAYLIFSRFEGRTARSELETALNELKKAS